VGAMSYKHLKRKVKIDELVSRYKEIHDGLIKYLEPIEYFNAIMGNKYPEGEMGDLTQKYLKEASEARDEVKRLRAIEAKRKEGLLPPRDW